MRAFLSSEGEEEAGQHMRSRRRAAAATALHPDLTICVVLVAGGWRQRGDETRAGERGFVSRCAIALKGPIFQARG